MAETKIDETDPLPAGKGSWGVINTEDLINEAIRVKLQEIGSDEVIKRDLVKNVMYKRSNLLSVGLKVMPQENTDQLEEKLYVYRPSEISGEFPVPENAISARAKPVEYHSTDFYMQMAEFRFMITHWARARGRENWAFDAQTRAGSDYFARCIDQQIIDAIYAGAGATAVTVDAGSEWNSGDPTANPEKDIMNAWNNMFDESNMNIEEMGQVALVYPAKVDATLRGLRMIGNINQSLMQYLKNAYGFNFWPTRFYHASSAIGIQDDALLIVNSRDMGVHKVFTGSVIPLTYVNHLDRGDEYVTRKIFGTKIMPETGSVSTNYRICKIANVV